MEHRQIGDIADDYTFELASHPVILHVEHLRRGTTMTLFALDGAGNLRPSELGVEGFDTFWDPGFTVAYDVPEAVVNRLVHALKEAEVPTAHGVAGFG